ncbi:RHS repeat-associated core domain-containing protein [Aeromonas jandaei]|uniref:RHS repeat-associated core domain-containing protein n=1 Tax=Aeromonas jandaei TaxID=650 RepID=UPI003B9F1491
MLPYHVNASVNRTSSAQRGGLLHNRIHFNGVMFDPLLGVQHLGEGYRAYNATLHRFHAMDSLSPFNEGGVNAYGYVYNDPVNYEDPSGHRAQWVARLSAFVSKNPAESIWMGIATVAGVVSGSLWAASTQRSDSETVNSYNLAAGILAAVTAVAAAGAWVSSKNPLTRTSNQVQGVRSPSRGARGPSATTSSSRHRSVSRVSSYRGPEAPPEYEMAMLSSPVRTPNISPARASRPATAHARRPDMGRY